MDLKLTPEESSFRDELRAWLAKNAPKDWAEVREKPLEESYPYLRAWQRKLHDGRWAAVSWPKEYGGRRATLMQQALFWEEMARVEAPPMANSLGLGLIGPTIIAYGTEAQKQRYIPKILSAEEIWCQLYSEPNAGSDLAGLRTNAVRENFADGEFYVVNGQKVWTSQAHLSDFAVLLARTDPSVAKHRGISYFIFDMHAPGVEVRPLKQITGTSEFNEVFFTDVKVPIENLIGVEGQGWELAQTTLGYERGGNVLGRVVHHRAILTRLIEVCQTLSRDGVP